MKLADIAKWVDENLHESVTATRALRVSRIVGVTPPGDGRFRTMTVLESNPDPYDLLNTTPSKSGYEAFVIVMTGTMSKLVDEDDEDSGDDEDYEPESFVVRICAAVNDDGVAVAVRRDGDSDLEVNVFPDGGEGAFPDALRLWWGASSIVDEFLESLAPND